MNRRPVISLLIGVIAALAGFWAATALRASRCAARGGQWDAARRMCIGSDGALSAEPLSDLLVSVGLALLLALFVAFVFWRLSLIARGAGPTGSRR